MQARLINAVCTAVLVLCGLLTAADLGRLVHQDHQSHQSAPGSEVVAAAASPAVPLGPALPEGPPVSTTIHQDPQPAPTSTTLAPRYFAPQVSRSAPLVPSTTTTRATSVYQSSGYSTACYPSVGMAPRNSTEACISAREHGGCYSAGSNPSHQGRWQLSESLFYTVNARPASPSAAWSEWWYASPGTQDSSFRAIVARDGYGPWTPYDGC